VHRSPQGHPVIVQAGQSDDGRDLAGRPPKSLSRTTGSRAGRAFYADIKRRAAALRTAAERHQGDARRHDRHRAHARRSG